MFYPVASPSTTVTRGCRCAAAWRRGPPTSKGTPSLLLAKGHVRHLMHGEEMALPRPLTSGHQPRALCGTVVGGAAPPAFF